MGFMADFQPIASSPLASSLDVRDPARSAEQVRTLAAEFESMLLGQMLRQMRSSMFEDEGEGGGMGTGPLADTVFSELSLALSRAGGLGIGSALLGPLSRESGVDLSGIATNAASLRSDAQATVAANPIAPLQTPASIATLSGRVTSRYGWRRDPIDGANKFHKGVDIAVPVGSEVPSSGAGRVTFAGELPGYGLTVVVAHDDRRSTRYAHLSRLDVVEGATVTEGQVLGLSGATGRVTGPHLHFEALEDGKPVDPADSLKFLSPVPITPQG
jgi:murein DD-endopeptidase MepM/ murein hydrolase activator NlpD